MSIERFEELHNVRLIPKSESWLLSVIGFFRSDFLKFCTTYRLPFQPRVTMAYVDGMDPMENLAKMEHELDHADVFAKWWGPYFMALAIFPPGRWFVERHPYLEDIRAGRYTATAAATVLWHSYGIKSWRWPSPRYMHAWFVKQLEGE
jgi:hypothetical protein